MSPKFQFGAVVMRIPLPRRAHDTRTGGAGMRGGLGLGLLGIALLGARATPPEDPAARALRVHRDAIVLDTHADTTPHFQDPSWDFAARHPKSDSDIDL